MIMIIMIMITIMIIMIKITIMIIIVVGTLLAAAAPLLPPSTSRSLSRPPLFDHILIIMIMIILIIMIIMVEHLSVSLFSSSLGQKLKEILSKTYPPNDPALTC